MCTYTIIAMRNEIKRQSRMNHLMSISSSRFEFFSAITMRGISTSPSITDRRFHRFFRSSSTVCADLWNKIISKVMSFEFKPINLL